MQEEKDMQPPLQDEREGLSIDQIEGNPQGWDLKDISNEASSKEADETWQGREESKNDLKGKANANG